MSRWVTRVQKGGIPQPNVAEMRGTRQKRVFPATQCGRSGAMWISPIRWMFSLRSPLIALQKQRERFFVRRICSNSSLGVFLRNRVEFFRLWRRSALVDRVIVSSSVGAGEAVQHAFLSDSTTLNVYDGGRCWVVKRIRPQRKDGTGPRTGGNGGTINIRVLARSSAATGPRVRTETITMTDTKRSGSLVAAPLHAGSRGGEAAGKTWARRPPGENKLSLMGGKKAECFCLPAHHTFMITLYHSLCGLQWAELFFFFSFFCLQILAVRTLTRCTFGLRSLARRSGAPRPPLPRRCGQSQLVCEG